MGNAGIPETALTVFHPWEFSSAAMLEQAIHSLAHTAPIGESAVIAHGAPAPGGQRGKRAGRIANPPRVIVVRNTELWAERRVAVQSGSLGQERQSRNMTLAALSNSGPRCAIILLVADMSNATVRRLAGLSTKGNANPGSGHNGAVNPAAPESTTTPALPPPAAGKSRTFQPWRHVEMDAYMMRYLTDISHAIAEKMHWPEAIPFNGDVRGLLRRGRLMFGEGAHPSEPTAAAHGDVAEGSGGGRKAPERTDASGASSEGGRGDTDTPDLTSVRSEGVSHVSPGGASHVSPGGSSATLPQLRHLGYDIFQVTRQILNDPRMTPAEARAAVEDDTRLVTMLWAHSATHRPWTLPSGQRSLEERIERRRRAMESRNLATSIGSPTGRNTTEFATKRLTARSGGGAALVESAAELALAIEDGRKAWTEIAVPSAPPPQRVRREWGASYGAAAYGSAATTPVSSAADVHVLRAMASDRELWSRADGGGGAEMGWAVTELVASLPRTRVPAGNIAWIKMYIRESGRRERRMAGDPWLQEQEQEGGGEGEMDEEEARPIPHPIPFMRGLVGIPMSTDRTISTTSLSNFGSTTSLSPPRKLKRLVRGNVKG